MAKSSFTTKEAEKLGITRLTLGRYVQKGLLERVARGVYTNPQANSEAPLAFEDLFLTAQTVPNGVICLVSALSYYELTEQTPRAHWIAVSHRSKAPKRPLTKIVRMRNLTLGKIPLNVGHIKTFIFDRERTVIDAFRHLDKETAIKALRMYLDATKGHRPDLKKLNQYAKALRTNISEYMLALTA